MIVASLVVSIAAILIALASAYYARTQAVAASRTAAIERERWHADKRPVLKVTCDRRGADGADVAVELTGPDSLDRLDKVTVRVRDDMPDRRPREGSPLSQEQIAEVIWGPFRIRAGLKDTSPNGRQHGPFPLPKNEPYPLPMERSITPSWASAGWHDQYRGKPIRLEFTCAREGSDPWVVLAEVRVPPDIMNTIA